MPSYEARNALIDYLKELSQTKTFTRFSIEATRDKQRIKYNIISKKPTTIENIKSYAESNLYNQNGKLEWGSFTDIDVEGIK